MAWRVEKQPVVEKVWGPDDTYETAGYGGPQVFGFRRGQTVYRVVSDFTDNPEGLYEFVEAMNEAIE